MTKELTKTRARAPLRLGLAGGGTDLSPYCDDFGGAVLNVTISKFALATITPRSDGLVVFHSQDTGVTESFQGEESFEKSTLSLHRGVYERVVREFCDHKRFAVTVSTHVEAPQGSGLGASSALMVAMVDAFRLALNAPLGRYDVARLAFDIERVDLGLAGGRQDQYAAAFGGLNFIEFHPNERVIVNPLRIEPAIESELESSLVVCFSGASRQSADIIIKQTQGLSRHDARVLEAMHQLKEDAVAMKRMLFDGDVAAMARRLNRSWLAKKATAAAVTNNELDRIFELGLRNGAIGGKVSGAGGGGFMFFIVEPERKFELMSALRNEGLLCESVKFNPRGCEAWHTHQSRE